MVSAEPKEYAEVSAHQRIAEYNDLTSMEILHRNYPDKWKTIIYERVIYRVILINRIFM